MNEDEKKFEEVSGNEARKAVNTILHYCHTRIYKDREKACEFDHGNGCAIFGFCRDAYSVAPLCDCEGYKEQSVGAVAPVDDDFEKMMISALKYATETRWKMSEETADYICRLLPDLSTKTITIIWKYLERHFERAAKLVRMNGNRKLYQLKTKAQEELARRRRHPEGYQYKEANDV